MRGSAEGGFEFQYALLRVVPRLERGEQMNAGVVLFARRASFLAARVALDAERLRALAGADVEAAPLQRQLDAVARVAAGDAGLGRRVAVVVRESLARPREQGPLARAVRAMRERIFKEHGSATPWNLKHARGGIVEVEFVAQFLVLAHAHAEPRLLHTSTVAALEAAGEAGLLPAEEARALADAFALFQSLLAVLRLSLGERFDPAAAPPRLLEALVRAAALAVPGDVPPADFAELEARLVESQEAVRQTFARLCPSEA